MERRLARIVSPPRHAAAVGLGICALGLAAVGVFAGSTGAPDWSAFLLIGSSLLTAGAAGMALHPSAAAVEVALESAAAPPALLDLLGKLGDGVWDYDIRAGRIVYTSACATMLGYAAGEISSTMSQWGTLVHEDDLPRARRALDDYLEGRADRYQEVVRLRCKSGAWVQVIDSGCIVERDGQGQPKRAIGLHRRVEEGPSEKDVTLALSADLDQALAGLLGQAALASLPAGAGVELERAAWRCVALAHRLKLSSLSDSDAARPSDVAAFARSIAQDTERWTPGRVLLRVRCEEGASAEVLSPGVFRALVELGVDEAVERMDANGGTIEIRLSKQPELAVDIITGLTKNPEVPTKRMLALHGLAARRGVAVSTAPGSTRLVWPARA